MDSHIGLRVRRALQAFEQALVDFEKQLKGDLLGAYKVLDVQPVAEVTEAEMLTARATEKDAASCPEEEKAPTPEENSQASQSLPM